MHERSPRRDALRLDRVLLRGGEDARPDPLRARLRLERTLAATDWTPAGLPPGALLFVRRLRVQGPGFDALGRVSAGGRDPFADDRAFASHVADALRAQGRAARRPWADDTAVDADAVWFEDEDELAACLVRDWLRGRIAQRWWWRSVLAGDGVDAWLRREVLSRGERLAPTLHRLAAASSLVAWLSRMGDADAHAGCDALVRAYALEHLRAHAGEVLQERVGDASDHPRDPGASGSTLVSMPLAARRWLQGIVPELGAAAWRPAQARLLACGLALLRAPTDARSRRFAEVLSTWRPAIEITGVDARDEAVVAGGDIPPGDARFHRGHAMSQASSPHSVPGGTRPRPPARVGEVARVVPVHARTPSAQRAAATPRRTPPDPDARMSAWRDVDARQAPASGETLPLPAGGRMPVPFEPSTPARVGTAIDASAADVEATASGTSFVVPARTIATAHGGLFYLLNAALSLGLYGDFTSPRTQGLSLSPWDLLAWLGLHWFGRAFRRDPLWRLLAELAGRSPKRAPAWRVDAPARWAPLDDWLRPWAPMSTLDHGVDRRARRLQLRHPDGFLVFDVPRDASVRPRVQARALCRMRACAADAHLARRIAAPPLLPLDPGARWLHCFAGFLAVRLMRAFGTASPRRAVVLLCRHEASVRCDASRVEVALSLAHLPLPVRIAGLDRDPGWIPAAGRDLRFLFS